MKEGIQGLRDDMDMFKTISLQTDGYIFVITVAVHSVALLFVSEILRDECTCIHCPLIKKLTLPERQEAYLSAIRFRII